MAIYEIDGNALNGVYSVDGSALPAAFIIEGEQIFPDGPQTIKIATYNVGGWYTGSGTSVPSDKVEAYLEMQESVIEALDADIICINEYHTFFDTANTIRAAQVLIAPNFPYSHGVNGSSPYFGRCLCSKYPIIDYTENVYAGVQLYYDVATINVNGTYIKVIVTHISGNTTQARIGQALELHDYIVAQGFERYMVCGDTNIGVTIPFEPQAEAAFTPFIEDGCALANGGAFGIFDTYSRNSTYTDNNAIDNIIASNDFTINSVSIDMTKVRFQAVNGERIDHIPLIAEIEIPM